ncbi:MAG TPA: DUF4375 domain-containing protein [Fimbriimonadaceae bacterium]|nr:DUF4375 domain-containing protein [Fimbriimonadaceae bacterium]
MAERSYWDWVEPVWDSINIYDGPELFLKTYREAPSVSRLLFAAHFCQSEVCNGGLWQFFENSTGVLAPEAVEAFRRIGQDGVAATLAVAMDRLGSPYPRDREERWLSLDDALREDLDLLDDRLFELLNSESGGFESAALRFALEADRP